MKNVRMKSLTIAALNHFARQNLCECVTFFSRGVMDLSPEDRMAVLNKVSTFEDFDTENDPYGEGDFGMVEHQGEKYFWKFDYYDADMQ